MAFLARVRPCVPSSISAPAVARKFRACCTAYCSWASFLYLPVRCKNPTCGLAGILVKVGYDIIDIAYLKRAHQGPRFDLMLMALVLGLTVFVDLITAVMAGVVIAALAFVKQIRTNS